MAEHTKTPWHVDGGFIRDAQGGILCVVPNNPENGKNWKNDAAFIVKACNSYELLIQALKDIQTYTRDPAAMETARDALASLPSPEGR